MAKKEEFSLDELLEQALVKEEDMPYDVPSNWVWTKLGRIMQFPKDKFNPESSNLELKYVGLEHLAKNRGIIEVGLSNEINSTKNCFKENDIIYGRLRPYLNKHDITNFKGICSTDILVFRCISYVSLNRFINYYLDTEIVIQYAIANSKGINLPRVSEKELAKMSIPLPPLPEQQRIVDLIESLFEKLDRAKELVQNALDSFEERKSAILYKAFTGEITDEWREENGVDFERDWVKKELKDCGEWCGGGTPSKSNLSFWEKGDLLWVSPKDMKSMCIEDTEDKITKYAVDNSSAKLIKNQAILFVVRSGILRRILPIAITMGPVTVNQDMKALIPKDIDIKYLYWYCLYKESDIRNTCSKNGTTVESISSDLLYKYIVLLPPIEEQRVIVRSLDTLLESEQKAKELCDVIENIDIMKKSILARAFRGELSTNNPNEESALELLKEVLRGRVEG